MRSPCAVVVMLLLLFGASFASFDASEYLYYGEATTSVSKEPFVLNGTNYELVKIGGQETFLTKGGSLMMDASETYGVMYGYYRQKYYPSDSEIDEIRDQFFAFNNSRNNGEGFKGKEEQACLQALFGDGRIMIYGKPVNCINDSTCIINAQLVFQAYKEGVGWGSANEVLSPLKDFSYAHHRLEVAMNSTFLELDNMSEGNMYSSLQGMQARITGIKADIPKIEKNLFRMPKLNDTADKKDCYLKCYGICPSFAMDTGALNLADTGLTALIAKVAPFGNYAAVSARISNGTTLRIEFKTNETQASSYYSTFEPLRKKGNSTIAAADSVLKYAVNTTYKKDVDRLKALHGSINSSIAARSFTGLDADIAEYSKLISSVNRSTPAVFASYNNSLNAKNAANNLLFILDSKDMGTAERARIDSLKNRTSGMNVRFKDGMLVEEYNGFYRNYTNVSGEAQALMDAQKGSPVSFASLKFRGFARRVNGGLASFLSSTSLMDTREVPQKQALALGGFSALVFLSLGSLLFIALMALMLRARKSKRSSKVALLVSWLAVIIALGLFSGMLYVYLQKTSADADLEEFINDFGSKNSTAVVVELGNASSTDAAYLGACGTALADALAARNLSVATYRFTTNSTCIMRLNQTAANQTVARGDCEAYLANESAVFSLEYGSAQSKPSMQIIYLDQAKFTGDAGYYKDCPVATLFK